MNLVWTQKSGNKGPVLLCSDTVAQLLTAKGLAIDLDNIEAVEPIKEQAVKLPTVPKNKVKQSKKKKK